HGPCSRNAVECDRVLYPLFDTNPYCGNHSPTSDMYRSLVTFASTDAAATHATMRSPCRTGALGTHIPGTAKASVNTYPTTASSRATARRIPSIFATWTPEESTSAGDTETTEQLTARSRTRSYTRSRAGSVSCFESVSSASRRSFPGRSTQAATTNGPAQAPRPTSSTPATGPRPLRSSAFCSRHIPPRRITARLGTATTLLRAERRSCGLVSLIVDHRDGGSTISRAFPMMLSTGTAPAVPPPPWHRESHELPRLSPSTQTSSAGTVTGPNSWF